MSNIGPSYWPISQLPGLKETDVRGLQQAGIGTTEDLLNWVSVSARRQQLATQLKHKVERVNRWVAMADLARVPSVGCTYCGLLLHSGVLSPQQLASANAPKLQQQVRRLYVATLSRTGGCPSLSDVNRWIAEAKHLVTIAPLTDRQHSAAKAGDDQT